MQYWIWTYLLYVCHFVCKVLCCCAWGGILCYMIMSCIRYWLTCIFIWAKWYVTLFWGAFQLMWNSMSQPMWRPKKTENVLKWVCIQVKEYFILCVMLNGDKESKKLSEMNFYICKVVILHRMTCHLKWRQSMWLI